MDRSFSRRKDFEFIHSFIQPNQSDSDCTTTPSKERMEKDHNSYQIVSFEDLVGGEDVFRHVEKISTNVLLPPVSFQCTTETVAGDGVHAHGVDGDHAVGILNRLQQVDKVPTLSGHTPLVLSTLDNLVYALLTRECCQRHAAAYSQCLASLQHTLDCMHEFGPVSCSRLKAYAFGSTVCGMQNKESDMDICVDGKIDSAPLNTWEGGNHLNMLSSVVRFSKQKFLHELADLLILKKIAEEETLERIIHARIPVFKYVDRNTGIKCDIIVGGETFRFKATVLALLGSIDWRFLALVRLVKLWAARHNLLDASLGMLNSYSLKLLVLFHLQNRHVPVLPTLCIGSGKERPIQNSGRESHQKNTQRMHRYIEDFKEKAIAFQSDRGKNPEKWNRESLAELFVSFMQFVADLTSLEHLVGDVTLMQRLKIDTWDGSFLYSNRNDTERAYHLYIRDPFESKADNAARSLSLAGEREIQAATAGFSDKFLLTCGLENPTYDDILDLFSHAFEKEHTEVADSAYREMLNEPMSLSRLFEEVDDSASTDCLLGSPGTKSVMALLKENDSIQYKTL